jgi:hypothetical protein
MLDPEASYMNLSSSTSPVLSTLVPSSKPSSVLSAVLKIGALLLGVLLLLGIGSVAGLQLDEFNTLPKSLTAVLAGVGIVVGLFSTRNVLQNPAWRALALIAGFFWAAFFAKISFAAFALVTVSAIWLFFKQAKWLWQFTAFRMGLVFALLSTIYYFGYASNFQVVSVQAGYQLEFAKTVNDLPAKFSVLIWGLSIVVGLVTGLGLFVPNAQQPKQTPAHWIQTWGMTITLTVFIMLGMMLSVFPLITKTPHLNVYLPPILMFAQFLAGWVRSATQSGVPLKTPRWITPLQLSQALGIIVILLWLMFPLIANKTTLVAGIFILGLQAFLSQKAGFGWHWGLPKLPTFTVSQQLLATVITVILGTMLVFATGLNAAFEEKLDYFTKGFSNTGTLRIREENLYHLFEQWRVNATPTNILMGNGLAKSREDIFYVSAQRRWQYGILVQTVHNLYVEIFYDYGVMALWYFATWAFLCWSAIQSLRNNRTHPVAKHAATVLLCLAVYIAIYGSFDGIVVGLMAQLFTILGVLEGVRRFWPLLPDLNQHALFTKNFQLKTKKNSVPFQE